MSPTAAPATGTTLGSPTPGPTDRLVLRGLRLTGHHGVFAHERRDGQVFVVDVTLVVDASVAAASDDLADTVDYGVLADQVRQVVEGEPVDLIETVAERIATVALGHLTDGEVEVTVHKPQAPLTIPFEDVSLTITRSARPARTTRRHDRETRS